MNIKLIVFVLIFAITWQSCCPKKVEPQFEDISFPTSQRLWLDLGYDVVQANLNGNVEIDEEGIAEGSLTIEWSNSTGFPIYSTIEFSNGDAIVTSNGESLSVFPESSELVLVNGNSTAVAPILELSALEMTETNDPAFWSPSTINLAVFSLLATIPSWQIYIQQLQQFSLNTSFGCKVSCIGIGAVVAAIITVGCTSLIATCLGGTIITVGGFAVSCAFIIAVCGGGAFAGPTAAYEAWLIYW